MNFDESLAWLDAHVNLESLGRPAGQDRRATAPTLDSILDHAALLGSQELSYTFVHLTATKGKTSVARMVSTLLVAGGLSVGSTTSPHLERVNERIAWNGDPVDDETLARLLSQLEEIEEFVPDTPSYFELLVAAAFTWFADVAVDVAVVEVGLGGTWDATNIVDSQVAVVTNVSIDHVEYLGPTREDIAREKAGIVKPGSTLVLGETDPELRSIFLDRSAERVVVRDRDFGVRSSEQAYGGRLVDLYTPGGEYEGVYLPLHGAHQADNAAIALAAAETFLGGAADPDLVRDAVAEFRSPGRLEVVGHEPLVLLDGAHNVAGAESLRRALRDEFPAVPRTLVVGLLREKEPHEMLEALGAVDAARLICCRPPSARALDPAAVAAAAADLGVDDARIHVAETVEEAVARALALTPPDEQVIVTGSLYVVGAARHVLVT